MNQTEIDRQNFPFFAHMHIKLLKSAKITPNNFSKTQYRYQKTQNLMLIYILWSIIKNTLKSLKQKTPKMVSIKKINSHATLPITF
jgi:hypothetical protein